MISDSLCKDTKKNAHLQTFPQKNCTYVHFLVAESHTGLHEYVAMLLKRNRFSEYVGRQK